MCCHLQKNRPSSQKDRRLIKTGRQAGQTFGVKDLGHRGEKNHVTFHFHSRLTGGFKPFLRIPFAAQRPSIPSVSLPGHTYFLCTIPQTYTNSELAQQGTWAPKQDILISRPVQQHWRDRPLQGQEGGSVVVLPRGNASCSPSCPTGDVKKLSCIRCHH